MKTLEVTLMFPHPDHEEQKIVMKPQEVVLNLARVDVVLRRPLNQGTVVIVDAVPTQCMSTLSNADLESFARFDTVDGTKLFVNPEKVLFYFPIELGVYKIVLPSIGEPGGNHITVKATGAEIKEKLGVTAVATGPAAPENLNGSNLIL